MRFKKVNVPLTDITVTTAFKNNPPAPEKIRVRYAEYLRTGEVPGLIVLDEDNYILDGYAAYLVHQMMGSKSVLCLRIHTDKKAMKKLQRENSLLRSKLDRMTEELRKLLDENTAGEETEE